MLITAPHPTFVFWRQPYEWGTFITYLDRFARTVKGELNLIPDELEGALVVKPTLKHVRKLSKLPWVTLDIETRPANKQEPWTGKDPTRARLRCVGLGTLDWGFSYLWNGETPLKAAIKKLLADPKVLKVWQNGPWFDKRVLLRYGITVNNWVDIRDMRRVTVSTSRLSLAYMTSLYCDSKFWKGLEDDGAEDKNK